MDIPRDPHPSEVATPGPPGTVLLDEWQVTLSGPPGLTASQTDQLRRQVDVALRLVAEQLAGVAPAVWLEVSHSDGG